MSKGINKIIFSGEIEPGSLTSGTTDGTAWTRFMIKGHQARNLPVWLRCQLMGRRSEVFRELLREGMYVLVFGTFELTKWKARLWPRIMVDDIEIYRGMETEHFEIGEEGSEIEIPMQSKGNVNAKKKGKGAKKAPGRASALPGAK